jgi:hypothetical protein
MKKEKEVRGRGERGEGQREGGREKEREGGRERKKEKI